MYTNSHFFNVIACLKFFHKARKTIFYYPETTTYVMEFLNLLWRSGVLGGYTSGQSKFSHVDRYKVSHTFSSLKLNKQDYEEFDSKKRNKGLLIQIKSPRYKVNSVSFEVISKSALPKHVSFPYINKYHHKRNTQNTLYLNTVFGFISTDEIFIFNLQVGGLLIARSL